MSGHGILQVPNLLVSEVRSIRPRVPIHHDDLPHHGPFSSNDVMARPYVFKEGEEENVGFFEYVIANTAIANNGFEWGLAAGNSESFVDLRLVAE